MTTFRTKKNKPTQYVIGGAVAVIILGLWISLPLMTGSSLDSTVPAGSSFRSRVANISLLGSDISFEGGAPGSPLSGAMIDNPATSGADIASSLFQSGLGGEEPVVSAPVDAVAALPSGSSAPAGAPAPGGRLGAAVSLTAGNATTMSSGNKHDKFFGAGNQKSEFAAAAPADFKKAAAAEKSPLAAILGNSAKKSSLAAKTGNMDAARSGAFSAFSTTAKAAGEDLSDDLESKSVESGLQLGQTAQNLKKNDPSLSKTKITPPSKPEDATNESEEMRRQIKMMIIQMFIKAALGAVFGAVA